MEPRLCSCDFLFRWGLCPILAATFERQTALKCRDPGQPLSPIRLVWSLPDKRLWNAKMRLIAWSSSRKHPIPALLPYDPWLYLQECPSGCMLHLLLPQVWGPTASPQGSGLPRRSLPFATWRFSHAATLSAALQFISGYFSLGTVGMFTAIRRSFQDHEGKLDERYLSNNWR